MTGWPMATSGGGPRCSPRAPSPCSIASTGSWLPARSTCSMSGSGPATWPSPRSSAGRLHGSPGSTPRARWSTPRTPSPTPAWRPTLAPGWTPGRPSPTHCRSRTGRSTSRCHRSSSSSSRAGHEPCARSVASCGRAARWAMSPGSRTSDRSPRTASSMRCWTSSASTTPRATGGRVTCDPSQAPARSCVGPASGTWRPPGPNSSIGSP